MCVPALSGLRYLPRGSHFSVYLKKKTFSRELLLLSATHSELQGSSSLSYPVFLAGKGHLGTVPLLFIDWTFLGSSLVWSYVVLYVQRELRFNKHSHLLL